jgi:hypothetical protein
MLSKIFGMLYAPTAEPWSFATLQMEKFEQRTAVAVSMKIATSFEHHNEANPVRSVAGTRGQLPRRECGHRGRVVV